VVAFCLGVLYGLRRSEALALKCDDLDTAAGTLRIDEGLVAVRRGAVWSNAKNARSRRVISFDEETPYALAHHRKVQDEERLAAEAKWEDHDEARPPRLTSHGLRHTAATDMVRGARDVGELRAVADVLGHFPDMLMTIYAHALPKSTRAVADRIGQRNRSAEQPGVR
jgi:integrase